MNSNIVALDSLKPSTISQAILVRVARMWNSINTNTNEAFELNLQLLDDKVSQMHAVIPKRFMSTISSKIEEGLFYRIEGFAVKHVEGDYRPFDNTFKIIFSESTEFTKLDGSDMKIPRHKFQFLPFPKLPERNNIRKYLTDIVGVLRTVSDVINVTNKHHNIVQKREIEIEMERDSNVTLTLWGEKTELITDDILEQQRNPITIVVTSTTVQIFDDKIALRSTSATKIHFNLAIPEVEEMIKSCVPEGGPISKLLKSTMTQYKQSEHSVNSVTLSTALVAVKLEENLGTIFSFQATVKEVDTTNGWNYLSCTYCKGGVEKLEPIYRCKKCTRHVNFPVMRFRLKLVVMGDQTSTTLVAFDGDAQYLLKYTAPELAALANEENGEQKVQSVFDKLKGYEAEFQIKPTRYELTNATNTLTVYRVSRKGTLPKLNMLPASIKKENESGPSIQEIETSDIKEEGLGNGEPNKRPRLSTN